MTKSARKPVSKSKPTPKLAKKTTKKKQAPRADSDDELSLFVAEPPASSRARKRKAPVDADEISEEEPQSRKKYVQLEARTKRIPQEQIDTWPQVSAPVLEQIVAVMREAKKDIANTQRDERRVIAAHNALNPLVRTLSHQLATSRIPPQAKDMHFNIDKLTERITHVSREVTTARHSQQLLGEQTKIAERQLLKDEQNLKELKTNAKQWKSEWKHKEKHGRVRRLLHVDFEIWLTYDSSTLCCKNQPIPQFAAMPPPTLTYGIPRQWTLHCSTRQMPN